MPLEGRVGCWDSGKFSTLPACVQTSEFSGPLSVYPTPLLSTILLLMRIFHLSSTVHWGVFCTNGISPLVSVLVRVAHTRMLKVK